MNLPANLQPELFANVLRNDSLLFAQYFFESVKRQRFITNFHHKLVCDRLDAILNGTHPSNHLIINMPPRYTKSELAVVNFIALGFACNPESEFMHLSASDELVRRNIGNIRQIMDSEEYRTLFPDVKIVNNSTGSIRTDSHGVLYSAPFLGQITGFGCGKVGATDFAGAMVIDDPIKTQDALSEAIRSKINFTWANTLISRRNDRNTPVIVVAQRTHDEDFSGFLIREEGLYENGGKWDLLVLPAILDEGTENERPLWPHKHTMEELQQQRDLDPWVFDTQYMQNPRPIEGLMFPEESTKIYEQLPDNPDIVFCQIDPADSGADKTCSVIFYVKDEEVFVADIIYSPDNSEIVIPRILEQLAIWKPSHVNVEVNGGWRMYATELRSKAIDADMHFKWNLYTQHMNKEVRIFANAPSVVRRFRYKRNPLDREYRHAMHDYNRYLKMVRHQVDDFPDVICAACDWMKLRRIIPVL